MPHVSRPRAKKISRETMSTHNDLPISPALKSWIVNAIAPALAKAYLNDRALHTQKNHA